jgi:hypothetical protein
VLCHRIKKLYPDTPVMMVTSQNSESAVHPNPRRFEGIGPPTAARKSARRLLSLSTRRIQCARCLQALQLFS